MVLAPQLTESEDCTPRNWSRRRKRGTRSTTSTRGATTCAMAGLGRTATTYRPATSRPQRESSSQGGASRQECTGASTTRHASAPSSPNSGARPKMAQNFNEIKSHPVLPDRRRGRRGDTPPSSSLHQRTGAVLAAPGAGQDFEEIRGELPGSVKLDDRAGLAVDAADLLRVESETWDLLGRFVEHGFRHAAAAGVVARGRVRRTLQLPGFTGDHVDFAAGEKRAELLEGKNVVDGFPTRLAALRDARSDEDRLDCRILLKRELASVDHRTRRRGHVVDEIGQMLADEIDPRGTAGRRHERLRILLHALDDFLRLVLSRHLRAERNLHDVRKSDLRAGCQKLFDRAWKLTVSRRRHHGDELLAALDREEYVQQLRTLHHRAERTRGEALAAENASFEIDFGNSMFVLPDCGDGTGLFARYGRLDDRVKRAHGDALAAFDALRLVDHAASVDDVDRLLGTVVDAWTRKATAAVRGRDNLRVRAAAAGRAADGKRIVRRLRFALVLEILPQKFRLVGFLFDRNAQKRHQTVLDHRAVVVDAATRGVGLLRTELDGDLVDLIFECPLVERANKADHQFSAQKSRTVQHVRQFLR